MCVCVCVSVCVRLHQYLCSPEGEGKEDASEVEEVVVLTLVHLCMEPVRDQKDQREMGRTSEGWEVCLL